MPFYTEKNREEALKPLANYSGDDAFVKGQIYSMVNGGNMYDSARNYSSYKQAIEDAKANDNDNFFTGIGDFFVGKGADREKADMADQYVDYYSADPFQFNREGYNNDTSKIKTEKDLSQGRIFDGGLLGGIVNPFGQTASATVDLGEGALTGNWDAWNKRDLWSDAGAAGQVALTLATAGMGGPAATGLGTVGKAAALGAGGSALNTLNRLGKDTWTEEGLKELGVNSAVGGVVGGALGGIGYGLGKAGDKLSDIATNNRTKETLLGNGTVVDDELTSLQNISKAKDALSKAGLSQETNPADYVAISDLLNGKSVNADIANDPSRIESLTNKVNTFVNELGGKTATTSKPGLVVSDSGGNYTLQNLYDALGRINTIPSTGNNLGQSVVYDVTYPGLASTRSGRVIQGIGDVTKNIPTYAKNAYSKLSGSKLGNVASKVWSTKPGKVAVGVGGGMLLNSLINGGGNNQNNGLSDAEMQQLLNYYGGNQ